MNILNALKDMSILASPSPQTIRDTLMDNYHIIVCDYNNYGNIMIKYDLYIYDGILFVGKLSDSTATDIVITIEIASIYDNDLIDTLWDSYLSTRDVFLIDTFRYLDTAKINMGVHTIESIKEKLTPKEIIYLHDPYSNKNGCR